VPPVSLPGTSPGAASEDGYKDTERNICDIGEFVVNLVDEALAERMNICAVDFPARNARTSELFLMDRLELESWAANKR
jgi:flavin reductase (DIM6/NTAB) family NADH-FMN oxidoreductase RutF